MTLVDTVHGHHYVDPHVCRELTTTAWIKLKRISIVEHNKKPS